MTFTTIVPVRGGSKGLPGKNLRSLAGVPLWRRAVDQARAAGAGRIIVSTDIEALLAEAHGDDVEMLRRPHEFAADDTPMTPVVLHAIEACGIEGRLVLLQPTSPLRNVRDIVEALELHTGGAADLVMSVVRTDAGILKYGTLDGDRFVPLADPAFPFTNRQALPPVYRPNGAVYVFDAFWFVGNGGFVTDRIAALRMPPERSRDIDTIDDFEAAEALLKEWGDHADR